MNPEAQGVVPRRDPDTQKKIADLARQAARFKNELRESVAANQKTKGSSTPEKIGVVEIDPSELDN